MTSPTPPIELCLPSAQDRAVTETVRDAMRAALAGDFAAFDRLELDYLNLMVRIGVLFIRHPDGTPHWWFDQHDARYKRADREVNAPFATAIVRGFTREGHSALEWALYEKCRRCDGKLRRVPCRVCDGRWYVQDMSDHEIVYTDLDGVLLQEQG